MNDVLITRFDGESLAHYGRKGMKWHKHIFGDKYKKGLFKNRWQYSDPDKTEYEKLGTYGESVNGKPTPVDYYKVNDYRYRDDKKTGKRTIQRRTRVMYIPEGATPSPYGNNMYRSNMPKYRKYEHKYETIRVTDIPKTYKSPSVTEFVGSQVRAKVRDLTSSPTAYKPANYKDTWEEASKSIKRKR